MGSGDLVCYDFDGNEKWHLNLQEVYGKFNIQFGMSSTPILDGDKLYLQLIHGDGNAKTREAVVVALDKATGKQVWRQERPSEAYAENEHSYASPTLYDDGKTKYLITHGADYAIAHDLKDGSEIWRSAGINSKEKYNPALRLVTSPVTAPGLVIVPSAKNGPVLAIESGIMLTLDAKTGEEIYMERMHNHRHRASPVYADGKIYCIARDGVVSIIKAGRKFELIKEIKMDEDISASPAISNGRIYIRSFQMLWCIGANQVAGK